MKKKEKNDEYQNNVKGGKNEPQRNCWKKVQTVLNVFIILNTRNLCMY